MFIHLSNHKLVVNIQAAKEVPEDIMPEGEGLILLLTRMTVPVEGEEVVIFLVVGVVVVEQAVCSVIRSDVKSGGRRKKRMEI